MAPLTYKRRRRTGILNEDQRDQAVKRIQNEYSLRERERSLTDARRRREAAGAPEPIKKSAPREQQRAAEQIRRRANTERGTGTAPGGGAINNEGLASRPRRFKTTRGLRRLSFREAYSRRTTDTSRARVMALYGRTKAPSLRPGGNIPKGHERGSRTIPGPVSPAEQIAKARAKSIRRRGGVFRRH